MGSVSLVNQNPEVPSDSRSTDSNSRINQLKPEEPRSEMAVSGGGNKPETRPEIGSEGMPVTGSLPDEAPNK